MSREVCGICWCPYDEETGECACAPQGPTPPPEAQTEAEKIAYCAGWWDALAKARKAEPVQEPVWVCPDSAEHRYQKPGHCEDCGKTLVQEPVQFEPQEAVTEDGWCEWVCPKPTGYLMQCCDCGLIHEVDSRVAKYQPRPSEEFEVVDDPDLQVQWRMKRRDDISPKRKPLTEDEIALIVANCSASAHRHDDFHFARAIERAHGIKE